MARNFRRAGLVVLLGLGVGCRDSSSDTMDDASGESCEVPPLLSWDASARLIDPISDATHELVSIKDPSVVFFDDRWHIYATTANTAGEWSASYLNFEDWSTAAQAPQYYMDQTPGFQGYLAAPHIFFFEPQQKWYLVYQTQPPAYSTADDLSQPETWTAPQPFFQGRPPGAPSLWIDYWVICDDENCHLFFTGDDGLVYRSQTTIGDFPTGMSNPVTVMWEPNRNDLFEGSSTYRVKGRDLYLTLVEAIGGPSGDRYFRAFTSDRLDGEWTPLADTWEEPFAGQSNVAFEGDAWTADISHGELLRDGHDQTMTLDPCNMQLLFQGRDPASDGLEYSQLPYGLGLLTQRAREFDESERPVAKPPIRSAPPMVDTEPGADGNVVTNPGFETGTDGWIAWAGTLTSSTDQAHNGERSGLLTGRTDTWQGPVYDLFNGVTAGQAYQVTAWAFVSGEAEQPVNLTLRNTCDGMENYVPAATAMVAPSTWIDLSGTVTIPDCAATEIVMYVEGPAAGIDIYVDDVSVVPLE